MRGQAPRSNAPRAAATARSISTAVAAGTSPISVSLDGDTTGQRAVLAGAAHCPAMKKLSRDNRRLSTLMLRSILDDDRAHAVRALHHRDAYVDVCEREPSRYERAQIE